MSQQVRFVAFAMLATVLPGAEAATVRGQVNFSKSPVPRGTVTLHPASGPPVTARIDDGAFLIENVPAGRVGAAIAADGLPTGLARPETSGLSIDLREGMNRVAFELVAESIGAGEVAPPILVQTADGNAVMIEHLRGRTLIVAFASLATINDAAGVAQFEALKAVRRRYANRKDLLILWIFSDVLTVDGNDLRWGAFLLGQGRVDHGDGPRRFIDDSKWWSCTDLASWSTIATAPRFGVSSEPANFVIDADGRFAAVRVPSERLEAVVAKILGVGR